MPTLEQEKHETEENSAPEKPNPSAPEGEEQPSNTLAEPITLVEGLQGAFIEIADDDEGQWHWALWSGNGRIVARSGQTHGTFKSCVQSLRTIVKLWAEKIPIVRSHRS